MRETAAYLSPELSGAIALGLEIPPEEFINLTQSIKTNSVVDAPLAEAKSEYPVLLSLINLQTAVILHPIPKLFFKLTI